MAADRPENAIQEGSRVPEIDEVKSIHFRLMGAYVNAISSASLASQRRRFWPELEKSRTLRASGDSFLFRWLVGSHVRRRLNELAIIYLQLEQAIRPDNEAEILWLSKAREGCLAVAGDLPKLRLPGFIAIVSFAITVATTLTKLPGWAGQLAEALVIGLIAFSLIGYASLSESYRAKRSLFLVDAQAVDRKTIDQQKLALDNNIYAIEDELFRALQRGKKPETELDKIYITIIALLIIQGNFVWLWFLGGSFYIGFGIVFVVLMLQRYLERRLKHRVWL